MADNGFDRVVGADWVWIWDTTDTVDNWSAPVVEIREAQDADGDPLATSNGDSPTIILDGSDDLDVPATSFEDKVFSWIVPFAATAAVGDGKRVVRWIEASAIVDGRREVVFPAQQLVVRAAVAVR